MVNDLNVLIAAHAGGLTSVTGNFREFTRVPYSQASVPDTQTSRPTANRTSVPFTASAPRLSLLGALPDAVPANRREPSFQPAFYSVTCAANSPERRKVVMVLSGTFSSSGSCLRKKTWRWKAPRREASRPSYALLGAFLIRSCLTSFPTHRHFVSHGFPDTHERSSYTPLQTRTRL